MFLLNHEKIIILLDTNILLLSIDRPIDLFGELNRLISRSYKCVVLSNVLNELKSLVTLGSNKEKLLAKAALKMASMCETVESNDASDVDTAILNFAKTSNVVVATNDSDLKRKLRSYGIPVIYVKGFDHLDIEGEIIEE